MALVAYAAATVLAGLTILLVTGVPETIPAGLLAPVFLLPSITLFAVLARLAPARSWKHVGYWVPASGVLGYALVLVVMDLGGYIGEGSSLPTSMAVTFGIPALATYVMLLLMS
jgi:hypothetical protein